jgi:hypothetical protein
LLLAALDGDGARGVDRFTCLLCPLVEVHTLSPSRETGHR